MHVCILHVCKSVSIFILFFLRNAYIMVSSFFLRAILQNEVGVGSMMLVHMPSFFSDWFLGLK